MPIIEFISAYPYIFLFIGMFFLGETVLVPAIYYSIDGKIGVVAVIAISLIATLISDVIWYYIAKSVPTGRISTWHRVGRHKETFAKLSRVFDRHHTRILFLSKFVYGTRVLVQIICGMKKMHFGMYFGVNFLGSLAYILLLYFIAASVNIASSARLIGGVKTAMIVFVVMVIVVNLGLKYFIQRKWFQ